MLAILPQWAAPAEIQAFPTPKNAGFRAQTARAQENPNRPAQGCALRLLPAKLVQDLLRGARAFGRAALHKTLVVDRAVLAGEEDVVLRRLLVAGE